MFLKIYLTLALDSLVSMNEFRQNYDSESEFMLKNKKKNEDEY